MRSSGVIAVSSACALAVAGLSSAAGAPPSEPYAVASAARTLDAGGFNVGALGGVVVWEGRRGGRAALIRRIDGRESAIPGGRRATWADDILDTGRFKQLDLGLDARGRIVAVYWSCSLRRCGSTFVVDVRSGGERRLVFHTPPRCRSYGPVARWRRTIAATFACRGSGRSGVYVIRGRHARLVRRLSSGQARTGVTLDLGPDVLIAASADEVWVASLGAPACRTVVVPVPRSVDRVDVHATPGRAWWGFSTAADFGGSDFQFGTAAVGPACAVTDTRTIDTFPELDWATGTFAIDGPNVYVAGRDTGGVVTAPVE